MRGSSRLMLAGTAVAVLLAGCGDDEPGNAQPNSQPPAGTTTSTTSPAADSPSCSLVAADLVGSTFSQSGVRTEGLKTEDYLGGKDYSCTFQGAATWRLTASLKVFPASQSAQVLLDAALLRTNPYATVVEGVGDAAAYAIRESTVLQFVAVKKAGSNALVVHLIGTPGQDDQARYSAIAKEVIDNPPTT